MFPREVFQKQNVHVRAHGGREKKTLTPSQLFFVGGWWGGGVGAALFLLDRTFLCRRKMANHEETPAFRWIAARLMMSRLLPCVLVGF